MSYCERIELSNGRIALVHVERALSEEARQSMRAMLESVPELTPEQAERQKMKREQMRKRREMRYLK